MPHRFGSVSGLLLTLTLAGVTPASAVPNFSVDLASPSVPGVGNSDVLLPGPVGGPPVVAAPAAALGLAGGAVDELNAMTTGGILGLMHFSVDRLSVGVAPSYPPDVSSEALAGQQAGDIYITPNPLVVGLVPWNRLAFNQDILGELPGLPPGAAALPPIDDLDALDLGGPPAFFALAAGHPYLGASGLVGCGADIFLPGPAPGTPFGAGGLLLAACADDIDAMHIDGATGDLYFSLAPASPSLLPGSPIVGCAGGCGPADLFVAPGGLGPPVLVAPAAKFGLAPGDNIDALAWNACPGASGLDADADGIDDVCDNCPTWVNWDQWDSDVDGFGNRCDPDFNQDLIVGGPDWSLFRLAFGSAFGAAAYFPEADLDANGAIGGPETNIIRLYFGGVPGPSALPCAGVPPCTH